MWLLLFLPGKGERGREAAAGIFSSASAAVGCSFFPLRSHLNFLFFAGFALLSDFRLFSRSPRQEEQQVYFPHNINGSAESVAKKPSLVQYTFPALSKDNLKTCSPPFKFFLGGGIARALYLATHRYAARQIEFPRHL